MKGKISNPFVTGGYAGPEYFCDREHESAHLLKAISSKRNVTLISLRRMGKTGLLKHVKHQLKHNKHAPSIIYTDLLPTMNGNDMLNALSSALLREKQHEKNIFEKILSLLASLRPKVSWDTLTGQPSLELALESTKDIEFGFSHLMKFIGDISNDTVFMIDEFQQINRYPEKNMEQLLRTVIQTYPSVPFIFSGSSKHMLEPMFAAPGRPFYQSSELMYLDKIAGSEYREFITNKFIEGKKHITTEAIEKIFEWTRLHTYYVQYICNLLFEWEQDEISFELINTIFQRVLTSFEPLFANYRNLLPAQQYKLLQAIAVEDGIDKPTSGSFIHKYKLTSASSVNTSLKALTDKEMIASDHGRWYVYDVFFSRWLARHYGGKG